MHLAKIEQQTLPGRGQRVQRELPVVNGRAGVVPDAFLRALRPIGQLIERHVRRTAPPRVEGHLPRPRDPLQDPGGRDIARGGALRSRRDVAAEDDEHRSARVELQGHGRPAVFLAEIPGVADFAGDGIP
jgi:hypothetical protein